MAIEGTKYWEYRMYGEVPPNIPADHIGAWVMASVSWNHTILANLKGGGVTVHDKTPPDLTAAGVASRIKLS